MLGLFCGVILKNVEIIFKKESMYLFEIIIFIYDNYGFALISLSDNCIFRSHFLVDIPWEFSSLFLSEIGNKK